MTIMERKEREKEFRRQSILKAAESIFAQNGLHSTNLDEVAEKAEISKGTIYLYFDSKEDLFFSVIENKYQDYFQELSQELDSAGSLEDLVQRLIRFQLKHSQNHSHFFQIMMSEQGKNRQCAQDQLERGFVFKTKQVNDVVTKAMDRFLKNSTSSFSAQTLALSITGTINAHVMSWLISGKNGNIVDAENEILQLILSGIRG